VSDASPLYDRFAAAFVRGRLARGDLGALPRHLAEPPLGLLSPEDLTALVELGRERGLRLHRYKRTMGLARVARVLGVLRGLAPASLLDVGSGRGVFLWPLLEAFPELAVTATDRLEHRVRDLECARDGGLESLAVSRLDATAMPFADGSFDGVSMLEVLEHIPQAGRAIAEAVRVSRRFVVLSVPSQPDDNPEHIHLFARADLERLFAAAGVRRVRFEGVLSHTVAVANTAAAERVPA